MAIESMYEIISSDIISFHSHNKLNFNFSVCENILLMFKINFENTIMRLNVNVISNSITMT